MMENIKKVIQESIDVKRHLLNSEIPSILVGMAENISERMKDGGTLFVCGNGGSAADAQHFVAELSVRFKKERSSLPAIALGTNFSHLTAAGNDYGFEQVFSRQLEGIGKKSDVLLAISTSGDSENIINTIAAARHINMGVIGFTGQSGGKMNTMCDLLVKIPSQDVARIQESHILCLHILCELIEHRMFPTLE